MGVRDWNPLPPLRRGPLPYRAETRRPLHRHGSQSYRRAVARLAWLVRRSRTRPWEPDRIDLMDRSGSHSVADGRGHEPVADDRHGDLVGEMVPPAPFSGPPRETPGPFPARSPRPSDRARPRAQSPLSGYAIGPEVHFQAQPRCLVMENTVRRLSVRAAPHSSSQLRGRRQYNGRTTLRQRRLGMLNHREAGPERRRT